MLSRSALLRSAVCRVAVPSVPVARRVATPVAMQATRSFQRAAFRAPAVSSRLSRPATPLFARLVSGPMRTATRRMSTVVEEASNLSAFEKFKLNLPMYGAAAGGLLVVYGVSKTVIYITNTFMSINFSTVAYIAFVAGFGAAVVCAAMFASGYRMITIRPEPVFRAALSAVKSNAEVKQLLGGSVKNGHLRAYVLRRGTFGLDQKSRRLKWLPPRVQMLFQVYGKQREGMVSVEGTREIGSLRKVHISMLCVDVVRSSGKSTLVTVMGDGERLKVRGQLRQFLQSERVEYIQQTIDDDTTLESMKD